MKEFIKNLGVLKMPSSLWAPHVDPDEKYCALLRLNVCDKKLTIDKGILFTKNESDDLIEVCTFVNGEELHLDNVQYNVKNVVDIENMLLSLDNVQCLPASNDIFEESTLMYTIENTNKDSNCTSSLQFCSLDKEISLEYACSKCSCKFLDENLLLVHEHEHEKLEKPKERCSLCNICGKTLGIFSIKDHMLTHSLDKPFKCKVCRKSFAKSYNLKIHEFTHTGKRPYSCSECGKSYTAQSNLRTHIKTTHKTVKNYVCDTCNMTFVYPRYLRIHLRKHTGEKPFVCKVCGKSFSQKIHLTVHSRIHTGEKPHICEVCKKSFTTTGNLMTHKKTSNHHGTY